MDPKKNHIFEIMRYITSKYYYINKFDRLNNSQFVEDEKELSEIGKEIFINFEKKLEKIFFIDICGAPGMYSKYLIENNNASGIGISLPPEKGGTKFTFESTKYKCFYKDILDKKYKIELNNSKTINLGLASCVSYIDTSESHKLNLELILTSMNIILDNLSNNGDMIINLTMKNIYTCFNILDLILEQFDSIKLWKSLNVWDTKNTFYVFCYGFNKEKKIDMSNYIDKIKDDRHPFNNNYLGKNYTKINTMMNDIYMVRINAWLKNISSQA
jgi:hypothetical protein